MLGDDHLVVVRVGHAGGVDRSVAKHLAFGVDLCVPVGERQGLVVGLSVVDVLEPGDVRLVAVELVAERAVRYLVVGNEADLLFNLAGAIVVGEMSVGDAGEEQSLVLAVASHLAAAPAVVDGGLASAAAPSYECRCVAAALDGARAEAVLDEERRLAAGVAAEDACGLYARGIDVAHVAKVAKGDAACHLVGAAHEGDAFACGADGAGLVEQEVLDERSVAAATDEADVVAREVDVQLADAVLLSVEVSAIGIRAVADGLEQVAVFRHVDVLGETCVPVGLAELIHHTGEPIELAGCADHVEVALEGSIVELRIAAVDAEAVLELVRRNLSAGRVAVAGDVEGCAVAVELSACIDVAALYIIRCGIGVGAQALVPDDVGLVAVEREAEFAAAKRVVGEPVAVGALIPFALVVEVGEVVAVRQGHGAGLKADELAVPAEFVACLVGARDVAQVDAVGQGAAALVEPCAEGCGGSAGDVARVEAVLHLQRGVAALSYAEDAACRAAGGGNRRFVDAVFDDEGRACIDLCSACDAADAGGTGHGAGAVDDEIPDDRCAAYDAEEALEVACAIDDHALDAVLLPVEGAVVLIGGVQSDGGMCILHALIVNVGGEQALDGDLVGIVDHGGEPLHVGHGAEFVEAVGIGREVVGHEVAADGAPAVHVVVLGCGCRVVVAIGHFAYGYACAVHFAHGIDLLVGAEGHGDVVLAQRLVPVDGALVAVGLEAELAACHLVVGDVGAAAGGGSAVGILLQTVAVGEGGAVGRVVPGEGVHRLHLCYGDAVGVVHRFTACHPSHEAVVVVLVALHLDGGDAVAEGGIVPGVADEASVGGIGVVVHVDADHADAVLEAGVVAVVPGGQSGAVLEAGADMSAHDEVLHRAGEVEEHAGLLPLEVVVEGDGVPSAVEGAGIGGVACTEHEVETLDVCREDDARALIAGQLRPCLQVGLAADEVGSALVLLQGGPCSVPLDKHEDASQGEGVKFSVHSYLFWLVMVFFVLSLLSLCGQACGAYGTTTFRPFLM